jgi:hypothetical protein
MTDDLRKLAEAAVGCGRDSPYLIDYERTFRPNVVIGLLDRIAEMEAAYDQLAAHRSADLDQLVAERDEAREAVKRLAVALEKIDDNEHQYGPNWMAEIARSALADPVVRRIVEGE